jgi:hypothetical protein
MVGRLLIEWVNAFVFRWMSWRGPRKTNREETEEILKRKKEYERWAKEGK